jgi:mono/diheme cytochrome c family protein
VHAIDLLLELFQDGWGRSKLVKILWCIAVLGAVTGATAYRAGYLPVYAAANTFAQDQTPAPADATSVAGEKVYQTNCIACHGANRQGHPPMFPSLVGVGTRLSGQQITDIVHHGRGAMPPFSKLSDTEVTSLLHYLTADQPAPPPAKSNGNGMATAPAAHMASGPGASIYQQNCSFCHGKDAGGGDSGPDLTRSRLVAEDKDGDKISVVVRNGRPDNKMPKFTFTDVEMTDLVAFIHAEVKAAVAHPGGRRGVDVADLQTGNVDAGKRYFNGAGGCASCHNPTGDLSGIATRYQGLELEERMLYPRNAKDTLTVTLPSGEKVSGRLEYQDEFTVGLRDANGTYRSWPVKSIKYTIDSPVTAHVDLFPKYTDDDIHNLMAYIQTLK